MFLYGYLLSAAKICISESLVVDTLIYYGFFRS